MLVGQELEDRAKSYSEVTAKLTFLTEMVNLPVAAICFWGLLMVHVRFSVSPSLRSGKSKDANCPASQKGVPSDRLGARNVKVTMSGVSLYLLVTLSPVMPVDFELLGRGL